MNIPIPLFDEADLVWAKILNYPWWPGKITEIIEQKRKFIFKISFFGDSTYSYLAADQLIDFKHFDSKLNQQFKISGQLQKAIKLANIAFQKQKIQIKQQKFLKIDQNCQNEYSQIQQQSKIQDLDQSTTFYEKQIICPNQQKEKDQQIKILLTKYKLDNIPEFFVNYQSIQPNINQKQNYQASENEQIDEFDPKIYKQIKTLKVKKINKRKIMTKTKNHKLISIEDKQAQFMRKLSSVLIQRGINPCSSRQIAIKVKNNINEAKQILSFENIYVQKIQFFGETSFEELSQSLQLATQGFISISKCHSDEMKTASNSMDQQN